VGIVTDERYLVIGSTAQAMNVIEQLKKHPDVEILWAGEDLDLNRAEALSVKPISVEHPSNPDSVQGMIDSFEPDMVFTCPGSDRDLVNLIEGESLEQLLFEDSARTSDVPVIIVSSQFYG
jgi:hypothetical protein